MAIALPLLLAAFLCSANEVMPPRPSDYCNDYAHVISSATAHRLNSQLAEFERQTSNQILVAIFPKMESDSDLADYTRRIANSWDIGQKGKKNAAVLFIFTQDRKMFLQVHYGLEGALPDALAKQIIENEIKPYFKKGNFDGGVSAGVEAILKATRGEYKGSGKTANESLRRRSENVGVLVPIFFVIIFAVAMSRQRRGRYYGSSGYGWSSGWGGSGWSSGSSSSGSSSSDSFSGGGGGDFGGGGAGGSW